ncbi:hypothetical protein B0H19DRAFT_1250498 [Mycena capillaripes]|nr:hypothetical protein B0H19DRAFT_1250498 [Mycena capillaripes]
MQVGTDERTEGHALTTSSSTTQELPGPTRNADTQSLPEPSLSSDDSRFGNDAENNSPRIFYLTCRKWGWSRARAGENPANVVARAPLSMKAPDWIEIGIGIGIGIGIDWKRLRRMNHHPLDAQNPASQGANAYSWARTRQRLVSPSGRREYNHPPSTHPRVCLAESSPLRPVRAQALVPLPSISETNSGSPGSCPEPVSPKKDAPTPICLRLHPALTQRFFLFLRRVRIQQYSLVVATAAAKLDRS